MVLRKTVSRARPDGPVDGAAANMYALKLATRFTDLSASIGPKFEGKCELRPFEAGPESAK